MTLGTRATTPTGPRLRGGGVSALYAGNARSVLSRGLLAARSSTWVVVLSGFFEPVFFLLAMGVGLGSYIGEVALPSGREIPYAAYIAPALLAVSAMNGAVDDSTWNIFFTMHFGKLYHGMLATSLGPLDVALGEILYALLRGVVYAAGFLTVMQLMCLNLSWTAILTLPAVLLIAFGFASLGMAITSSLWHGVEMVRGLTTGEVGGGMLVHVGYHAGMIAIGVVVTTRRLRALFLG